MSTVGDVVLRVTVFLVEISRYTLAEHITLVERRSVLHGFRFGGFMDAYYCDAVKVRI